MRDPTFFRYFKEDFEMNENIVNVKSLPPLKPCTLTYGGLSMENTEFIKIGILLKFLFVGLSLENAAEEMGITLESCEKLLKNKEAYYTILQGKSKQAQQRGRVRMNRKFGTVSCS